MGGLALTSGPASETLKEAPQPGEGKSAAYTILPPMTVIIPSQNWLIIVDIGIGIGVDVDVDVDGLLYSFAAPTSLRTYSYRGER